MMVKKAVSRIFIDADDGEGWQGVGSAHDVELAVENIQAFVQVALELLLAGSDGDTMTLSLQRKDMTDEQVDAMPVV